MIGFIAGLSIGACLGCLLAALFAASGRGE
jgi:hypothetical protein